MDLEREKEIIKKAKQNPETFGLLYDKYYRSIFNYALKRTANIELAKDITSQTFFKALKNLAKFRWQNVPFSAWLYRIATNEISTFYRQEKKFFQISFDKIPELVSEDTPEKEIRTAEQELEKNEKFLLLWKSILTLEEIYQTVIILRFFDKKKISEISQILEKPEGTIKSQINRALGKLREIMTG